MSKLEDKALELIDGLTDTASVLATKLAGLVQEHGQAAIDLGLDVIRLEGAAGIFKGLLLAGLAGVTYKMTRKALAIYKEKARDADHPGYELLVGAPGAVTIGLSIAALTHLLNFWNWIAMFAPQIWLARKLILQALS